MDKNISILERVWRFDSKVAEIFDKHVNQSIPHYDSLQKYISNISEWYLKENSRVYDLGCSTGNTIINICKNNKGKKIEIIGYDTGKRMINLAKKKINIKKQKKNKIDVKLICQDINNIKKFKNADLFLLILTFPFFSYEKRKKILKQINKSLNVGGCLIIVDKIRSKNSNFEDILNQMYFDFKLEMKLTEKEIIKKAKSLRSSMHLLNQETTENLFKECNFKKYEIFFKCFNFVGYFLTK